MHLYPQKQKRKAVRIALPFIVIAAVLALFLRGFSSVSGSSSEQQQIITEQAIRAALVNCYAIEGYYPQQLSYLEEHYGLIIDRERYNVLYDVGGMGNVMPSVAVMPWGSGDHNTK